MSGPRGSADPPLKIALLVSAQTRYGPLAELVLGRELAAPDWQGSGPDLPDFLKEPPCLVVWDLSGFSPDEASLLAEALKPDHVGLLVVGGRENPRLVEMALGCHPNGLVTHPRSGEDLAAALFSCWVNYERIICGLAEREHHKQRLSDREVIEEAKMALIRRLGIKESEAMRTMQNLARNSNQRLADLARFLLRIT